jgi:hypothetical protein
MKKKISQQNSINSIAELDSVNLNERLKPSARHLCAAIADDFKMRSRQQPKLRHFEPILFAAFLHTCFSTRVARFFLVHDTNVPNQRKIYQMVTKYPKWP